MTSGTVTVRYWASARAAAGTDSDDLPTETSLTLIDLRRRAADLHPGTNLATVLAACSVLIGDQPVGRRDPAEVVIEAGETVEFLPPFAGG